MSRIVNACRRCGGHGRHAGAGWVRDTNAARWKFWKTVKCPDCRGKGYLELESAPLVPVRVAARQSDRRVTIIHKSFDGEHFAVIDVDCVEIGEIRISHEIAQSQEFWDGLRNVVKSCLGIGGR
jgi:hypothetical protein